MNTEIIMQYITYALIAIGILAFFVSAITQVIKEMPGLKNIQTNIVALVISSSCVWSQFRSSAWPSFRSRLPGIILSPQLSQHSSFTW